MFLGPLITSLLRLRAFCLRPFSGSAKAGMTLVETMISVGLMGFVAAGGTLMYKNFEEQSNRKEVLESIYQDQSNLSNFIKRIWDSRYINSYCTKEDWTWYDNYWYCGWEGYTIFWGFWMYYQNWSINWYGVDPSPAIYLYNQGWAGETARLDNSTYIYNECIQAPAALLNKVPNLNVNSLLNTNCSTCPAGSLPRVVVAFYNGSEWKYTFYPSQLASTNQVRLNASVGMQACFRLNYYVWTTKRKYGGQDVSLITEMRSLALDPSGKSLIVKSKELTQPMFRPGSTTLQRSTN